MRLLIVGAMLGMSLNGQAQDARVMNFKPFSEAAVVLSTGTIMTGNLRFYPDREVVSLTCANDSVYTLRAEQVRGFAAKDDATQQRKGDTYVALQRIFRAYPLPPREKEAAGWGFFEQLSRGDGPVLLLRRERAISVQMEFPPFFGDANAPQVPLLPTFTHPDKVTTTLYLRNAAGQIVALRKPDDVLNHFAQQASLLRAYAKQNNLRYTDNLRDLSFLVDYANTLPKPTP